MSEPTFNMADVQKLIAEAVATAVAANKSTRKAKGKPGGRKLSDDEKAKRRDKIEAETVANFKKAGYGEVKPREDVRTFRSWAEVGRFVRKGEKSIKCGPYPLFHVSQTDPIKAEGTVH